MPLAKAGAMQSAEIVATLLGIANIALLVRRSIWNYPFGLAMVTIYAVIFAGAKLYSDALLQIFFFVIQLCGWWAWARAGDGEDGIGVRRLSARARLGWIAAGGVGTALWGLGMARYTDAAYPFWDAFVAIYSICAQILLARRCLENWMLWIAVDAVAIGLYAARSLYLTTGLYILFLLFAIAGLAGWMRAARAEQGRVA